MPNRLSAAFKPQTIPLIQLLIVLGIALSGAAIYLLKADYLFTGTITAHQQWFPHLYLLTYSAAILFLPLLTGCWLALYATWLPLHNRRAVAIGVFLFSVIAVSYLIKRTGFGTIIRVSYLPAIIHSVALTCTHILRLLTNIGTMLTAKHYVSGSIFFACYVIGCLVCKDGFHPFYKYSMYQNINDTQLVFSLVDKKHNLIPIEQYYNLSENGIFNLHTRHIAATHAVLADKEAGRQLWQTMQQFKKRKLPYDSVSIIMTGYFVHNNRLDSVSNMIFDGTTE